VAEKGEPGLHAGAFAVKLGFRVRGRGVRLIPTASMADSKGIPKIVMN
jgi:hypothetical protein